MLSLSKESDFRPHEVRECPSRISQAAVFHMFASPLCFKRNEGHVLEPVVKSLLDCFDKVCVQPTSTLLLKSTSAVSPSPLRRSPRLVKNKYSAGACSSPELSSLIMSDYSQTSSRSWSTPRRSNSKSYSQSSFSDYSPSRV
jgi:hypothetical protein